jgi:hypothetical protein
MQGILVGPTGMQDYLAAESNHICKILWPMFKLPGKKTIFSLVNLRTLNVPELFSSTRNDVIMRHVLQRESLIQIPSFLTLEYRYYDLGFLRSALTSKPANGRIWFMDVLTST